MKKVTVLGCGMVGRTIAHDLASRYCVTVADRSQENLDSLNAGVKKFQLDLSVKKHVRNLIADEDLVIGALPGFMGYEALATVIECGKSIIDISFFPQDALDLDIPAKEKDVTAVVDCGIAPGVDNIILGYHYTRMQVHSFTCLVGGLPVQRTLPFQYKAPFSPIDVIEEYTRPARMIINGNIVSRPALSEPFMVEFDGVGTLEAFNTDGLRSLLYTMPVPEMKEVTLRYPGHRQLMEYFSQMGFFSDQKITVSGKEISPVDFTSQMFFSKWKYEEGEEDLTVMRVIVSGSENGLPKTYSYDLLDRYDRQTKTRSMSRTTGYTCAAVATMLLEDKLKLKGIVVPEYLGKDEEAYRFVLNYLDQRGVRFVLTQKNGYE